MNWAAFAGTPPHQRKGHGSRWSDSGALRNTPQASARRARRGFPSGRRAAVHPRVDGEGYALHERHHAKLASRPPERAMGSDAKHQLMSADRPLATLIKLTNRGTNKTALNSYNAPATAAPASPCPGYASRPTMPPSAAREAR